MPDDSDFSSRLNHAVHRDLYAYWLSRLPPNRLPGRQHVDPLDLPKLLPWIHLVDVAWQSGTFRFRHRLVGTEITQRFGRDVTGLWFEDAYVGDYLAETIARFNKIVEQKAPYVWHLSHPVAERDFLEYDRLALPLASDGETVDMLICSVAFNERRLEQAS